MKEKVNMGEARKGGNTVSEIFNRTLVSREALLESVLNLTQTISSKQSEYFIELLHPVDTHIQPTMSLLGTHNGHCSEGDLQTPQPGLTRK